MNNEFILPLESNNGGIVTLDACFIFQLCSLANFALSLGSQGYVPVNSKTAHIPPRAIPGDLTRVKLRTEGNLTQNEVRPVGQLTFVPKRLSAVGNKRISQFFDSASEPRSRVIGHYRNVRGLGKSRVVFRLFEKLRHSNEKSTIF